MPKMHKIALFISIVFLIIIISPFVYVEVNKNIYEKRVTNYLVKEQGYQEDEILSVEGVWGIKLPNFYTIVVFKNEPNIEYTYFAHNEVLQIEYKTKGDIHK